MDRLQAFEAMLNDIQEQCERRKKGDECAESSGK